MKNILAIFACILILAACSPKAVLTVETDGSGTGSFDTDMSATAETVMRRFSGVESNLYDGKAIRTSLARAGIKTDSIEFPKPTALSLGLSFLKLDGLFKRAIVFSGAERSLSVTLSDDSVHAAMDTMPAGMNDYLDLLMAPVFTGEKLTRTEYIDIIRSAYGKTLAGELEASEFTLTVRCPAPVTAAKIGKPGTSSFSGNQAVYSIPLSALLAMEAPLSARTEW